MSLSPITWGFFCLLTFALAGLFFTTCQEKAAANKLKESRRNTAIEKFKNSHRFDEPIENLMNMRSCLKC